MLTIHQVGMILVSGITESAIALVLGITFLLTGITHFCLYKLLMTSPQVSRFIDRLKTERSSFLFLIHILLFILSGVLLFGILRFRQYLIS